MAGVVKLWYEKNNAEKKAPSPEKTGMIDIILSISVVRRCPSSEKPGTITLTMAGASANISTEIPSRHRFVYVKTELAIRHASFSPLLFL